MSIKIYDQLTSEVRKNTSTQQKSLEMRHCCSINRMPVEHRKILFILIYHHYILKKFGHRDNVPKNRLFEIPYNGRIGTKGKGISFNTEQLPIDLQSILVQYIEQLPRQTK